MKRTLLSYKKRDSIDQHKRSAFYCLMLKSILQLSRMDESKAYRLLSTTAAHVGTLEEVKELEQANLEPAKLARLVLAIR